MISDETLKVLFDIANEREKQKEANGYTPAHDDTHTQRELARAANAYSLHYMQRSWVFVDRPAAYFEDFGARDESCFPEDWKFTPTNPREDLVRAITLLVAEVERLDRQALKL